MRVLIQSLGLTLISTAHYALNLWRKERRRSGILYATYEGNHVLTPIQERLPGLTLLSLSAFKRSSLLRRRSPKNTIRFTTIIRRPFIGMFFREGPFRKKLASFMLENQKEFLKRNSFEKIVMIDEFSMPHTQLTKAAKEMGILTIAMQHGIIHESHPGYMFSKSQKKRHVFPNNFISYGNYEKRLLAEKSAWDKEIIKPLGCPRYDFMKKHTIDEKTMRKRLRIPKEKHILFWPTQTHNNKMMESGENDLNADSVFKTIKEMEEWFLLIKFHPNENIRKSMEFYRRYQKKHGLERCAIIPFNQEETYDCILLSDCIISKGSTVSMEGILMDRPIITLDIIKSYNLSQFTELPSSLVVDKRKTLSGILRMAISKEYRSIYKKDRKAYITEHFTNFGHAADETVKFIRG